MKFVVCDPIDWVETTCELMAHSPTLNNLHIHHGYSGVDGYYDELFDEFGGVREGWAAVWQKIQRFTSEDLVQRDRLLRDLIEENGITYNVYSSESDRTRSWTMDMLPLIFSENEWGFVEQAMTQRVTLLNHLAADFYGRRRLLSEGHYPAALVLGNPLFLRPCNGMVPKEGRWINFYAADLARSPDGSWWVLSDRLEAASGLGYSLENRTLSTRVVPGLMRDAQIRRLQPFVRQLHDSFVQMGPNGKSDPTIVVLTPGPLNETYFEQAYLARNLGYPLVEGADLTVRDNKVFLKTIEGLQQIDVIVRRLDASWSDPLEFRAESMLGVPGLVNVVREGQVVIANSLGVGVLESAALPAFLPSLSQHVLGEELLIPSVATWWCGQVRERAYVLDNLSKLIVKPVFHERERATFFGPNLSGQELEQVRALIEQEPEMWCAQEGVSQATAPVYQEGNIQPRHFLVRVFMVPSEKGWMLMPGGLGRISPSIENVSVSMQHGGLSKDIWIRKEGNTPRSQSLGQTKHKSKRVPLHPQLPSRVADNLFWLGRYAERADHLARVLKESIDAVVDPEDVSDLDGLGPLLRALIPAEDYPRLRLEDRHNWTYLDSVEVLSALIWDEKLPGSLIDSVAQVQRTASSVRERLSNQVSGILRGLTFSAPPVGYHEELSDLSFRAVDRTQLHLAAFSGLIAENMTRGHGWIFIEIGRRIERAMNIAGMLRAAICQTEEPTDNSLKHILGVLDSMLTYRRRNLSTFKIDAILDLVIWDRTNPRGIQFQVDMLQDLAERLPDAVRETARSPMSLLVHRLSGVIAVESPDAFADFEDRIQMRALDAFLGRIQDALFAVSDQVSEQFFAITRRQESVVNLPHLQQTGSI